MAANGTELVMKKNSLYIKISGYLGFIIFSALSPLQVLAVDVSFYSKNDILFSNPDEIECSTGQASSIGATSGARSLEKTPTLETIFTTLITGGMTSIQASAVMGNMYWESHFNSDAHEKGNDLGYGLAQWTNYPIGGNTGRRTNLMAYAQEKGVASSDVSMQMEFLLREYNNTYKARLSDGEFATGTDISKVTESWMIIFEIPGMTPANDPAHLNSERIPAALRIYELYKDLSPVNGVVTTANCSSGNGAVAGSVVETALGFAHTTPIANGKSSKADALLSYQSAKDSLNPTAQWSDCGGFVATVMIASGVDPNYAKVGVSGAQIPYVRSHPEKYQIIENPTGVNDLQPGDILLTTGHTLIYTGKTPYPGVDASLNQRVPGVRPMSSITWMINDNAIVARVIK